MYQKQTVKLKNKSCIISSNNSSSCSISSGSTNYSSSGVVVVAVVAWRLTRMCYAEPGHGAACPDTVRCLSCPGLAQAAQGRRPPGRSVQGATGHGGATVPVRVES